MEIEYTNEMMKEIAKRLLIGIDELEIERIRITNKKEEEQQVVSLELFFPEEDGSEDVSIQTGDVLRVGIEKLNN